MVWPVPLHSGSDVRFMLMCIEMVRRFCLTGGCTFSQSTRTCLTKQEGLWYKCIPPTKAFGTKISNEGEVQPETGGPPNLHAKGQCCEVAHLSGFLFAMLRHGPGQTLSADVDSEHPPRAKHPVDLISYPALCLLLTFQDSF